MKSTTYCFFLLLLFCTACGNMPTSDGNEAAGAMPVSAAVNSNVPAMIGSRPGEAEGFMAKMLQKTGIAEPKLKEILVTFMNDGIYKEAQPHSFYVRYRSEKANDKEQEMHYDFVGDSVDKHAELNESNYLTGEDPYVFLNSNINFDVLPQVLQDGLKRGAAAFGNDGYLHAYSISVGSGDNPKPEIGVDVRNLKNDQSGLYSTYDAATGAFVKSQTQ